MPVFKKSKPQKPMNSKKYHQSFNDSSIFEKFDLELIYNQLGYVQ